MERDSEERPTRGLMRWIGSGVGVVGLERGCRRRTGSGAGPEGWGLGRWRRSCRPHQESRRDPEETKKEGDMGGTACPQQPNPSACGEAGRCQRASVLGVHCEGVREPQKAREQTRGQVGSGPVWRTDRKAGVHGGGRGEGPGEEELGPRLQGAEERAGAKRDGNRKDQLGSGGQGWRGCKDYLGVLRDDSVDDGSGTRTGH